jgi:hypothetical protein
MCTTFISTIRHKYVCPHNNPAYGDANWLERTGSSKAHPHPIIHAICTESGSAFVGLLITSAYTQPRLSACSYRARRGPNRQPRLERYSDIDHSCSTSRAVVISICRHLSPCVLGPTNLSVACDPLPFVLSSCPRCVCITRSGQHAIQRQNGKIGVPNKRIFSCKERSAQDTFVFSQVQVHTALMASEIGFPVKALAASGMGAWNLVPCCFVLEHVTAKIVNALESFIAFVTIEFGILCCRFDSARPVQQCLHFSLRILSMSGPLLDSSALRVVHILSDLGLGVVPTA